MVMVQRRTWSPATKLRTSNIVAVTLWNVRLSRQLRPRWYLEEDNVLSNWPHLTVPRSWTKQHKTRCGDKNEPELGATPRTTLG
jgi:hypothetical protein